MHAGIFPFHIGSHHTIISVKFAHGRVPPDVCRKVALHAHDPRGALERRRVAPRLERELALDDAREVRGPGLARERGAGRRDELRVEQVRAAVGRAGQ